MTDPPERQKPRPPYVEVAILIAIAVAGLAGFVHLRRTPHLTPRPPPIQVLDESDAGAPGRDR